MTHSFPTRLSSDLAMKPETDAAVSYYGVAIQARLDQIDEVRCPLLLHLAEDDHLCPPEAQEAIERAAAGHADGIHVMRHPGVGHAFARSEEHTSEIQSLMRIPYAVFCLTKK